VEAGVLLVEPRPLHVSLALRIVNLVILLASQFRKATSFLCVVGAGLATTTVRLVLGESRLGGGWVTMGWLTKVVPGLCVESTCTVVAGMVGNNSTESFFSSLNWPVCQRQVPNVVLIDHAEDRFLRMHMHLRVLEVILVLGPHFSESVVADQLHSLLFWLAVVAIEGRRKSA